MVPRWVGGWRLGGEVKGLRSTNSHRGVKCGVGNTVSDAVVTMCGVRWVLGSKGDHSGSCIHV